MGYGKSLLTLFLLCTTFPVVTAQNRDMRGNRIVLDDDNGNRIEIRTPPGPITGGTLTIPDPGGSGTLLISNPTAGLQSITGDVLLTGELRLQESGGGSNYVALAAPASVTSDYTWTLPAADGIAGQVLSTDGLGLLSWVTLPSLGGSLTAPYITASSSLTLTAERVLTGGTGVTVTDGGANGNMTVAIGQSVATTDSPVFAGATLNGNLGISTGNLSITTGNISTSVGNISTTTGSITTTSGDIGTQSGNLYADNGGELRLFEPNGSGNDYSAFKSGAQGGNITYTLPAANGTAGQVLRIANSPTPTGTTATLEWGTPSSSSGLGSIGGITFVRKTADEGVTSSTTLQNDDHLVVPLDTNAVYQLEGTLYTNTTNAGHDLQIAFTVPTGATMKIAYSTSRAGAANAQESDVLTSSGVAGTIIDMAASDLYVVFVRGTVRTSTTAGNLQLQWADDNTGGTQTVTIEADSYLRVMHVQ